MSSVALRKKGNNTYTNGKMRRHTLSGFEKQDIQEKLENYRYLLAKENEIRNKLDQAKSELELSLPLASENLKSIYTSNLARSYSSLPRNKEQLQLKLFSRVIIDDTDGAKEKTDTNLKTKSLGSGRNRLSLGSSLDDFFDDPFINEDAEQQRQKKIKEILEKRKEIVNEKYKKWRKCIESLDNDLIKAKEILDENRRLSIG